MQRKQFFEAFDAVIQTPKRFVVVSHVNPDGDAIGSSLAFAQFLKKLGHQAEVVVSNDFPEFLAWMPGACNVHIYDKAPEACDELLKSAEVLAILDFNHVSRSGLVQNTIKELNINKILIDHHRIVIPILTSSYALCRTRMSQALLNLLLNSSCTTANVFLTNPLLPIFWWVLSPIQGRSLIPYIILKSSQFVPN